jgi:hypothetical protein
MSRFRNAVLALAGLLAVGGCNDASDPTAPPRARRDSELPDGQVITIGSESRLLIGTGLGLEDHVVDPAHTFYVVPLGNGGVTIPEPATTVSWGEQSPVEGSRWTCFILPESPNQRCVDVVDSVATEFDVPADARDARLLLDVRFLLGPRYFALSDRQFRVRVNGATEQVLHLELSNGFGSTTLAGVTVHAGRNRLTFAVLETQSGITQHGTMISIDYLGTITYTAAAPDHTPPVITRAVSGALGDNGWYTGDVTVGWDVKDAESAVSKAGCDNANVVADTPGQTFTCEATSAGGKSSQSVTIKRDASAPVITFGGATSYTVDQELAVTCVATDPTSGVSSSTCPTASGPAYSAGVGPHTLDASATNGAGLTSTATRTYSVSVTATSLSVLVTRWTTNSGVANSLTTKLAHGQYAAFINEVQAQSGKSIPADTAAILIQLAGGL